MDLMIWYNFFYILICHIVVNVFYFLSILLCCWLIDESFVEQKQFLFTEVHSFSILHTWFSRCGARPSITFRSLYRIKNRFRLVYSWIEPIVLKPPFSSVELDLYQLLGLLNQISIMTAQILTNWSKLSLWSLNL